MGELIKEAAPKCPALSAQQVADAFVQQYYNFLRASPENLHKFYKDYSIMAHPGSEGTMVSATTMQGVNVVVVSSTYKGCDPMVDAVHAQDSIMGSVIVGVTGTLTDKENTKRKFAQFFFLAPQETGGFYVRNDILQFLDVDEPIASLSGPPQVPETLLKFPTVTSPRNSAYPPPGLLAVNNEENAPEIYMSVTFAGPAKPIIDDAMALLASMKKSGATSSQQIPSRIGRRCIAGKQPAIGEIEYSSHVPAAFLLHMHKEAHRYGTGVGGDILGNRVMPSQKLET